MIDIKKIINVYMEYYNKTEYNEEISFTNRFNIHHSTKEDVIYLGLVITGGIRRIEDAMIPICEYSYPIGELLLDYANIDCNILLNIVRNLESINITPDMTIGQMPYNYLFEEMIAKKKSEIVYTDSEHIATILFETLCYLINLHPFYLVFINELLECYLVLDGVKNPFIIDRCKPIVKTLDRIIKYIPFLADMIESCLSFNYNEELNQLPLMTRYYIFTKHSKYKGKAYYGNERTINYECIPTDIISAELPPEYTLSDLIKTYKYVNFTYVPNTPLTLDYIDTFNQSIISLIHENKTVKKCKLCNKFFFPKGNYHSNYCDKTYPGDARTCQQLASVQTYQKKVKDNPILKEYQTAYKRNYARLRNKKIYNDDFRLWVDEASQKRDTLAEQYEQKPNDKIVQDFKEYLGNK